MTIACLLMNTVNAAIRSRFGERTERICHEQLVS